MSTLYGKYIDKLRVAFISLTVIFNQGRLALLGGQRGVRLSFTHLRFNIVIEGHLFHP